MFFYMLKWFSAKPWYQFLYSQDEALYFEAAGLAINLMH